MLVNKYLIEQLRKELDEKEQEIKNILYYFEESLFLSEEEALNLYENLPEDTAYFYEFFSEREKSILEKLSNFMLTHYDLDLGSKIFAYRLIEDVENLEKELFASENNLLKDNKKRIENEFDHNK